MSFFKKNNLPNNPALGFTPLIIYAILSLDLSIIGAFLLSLGSVLPLYVINRYLLKNKVFEFTLLLSYSVLISYVLISLFLSKDFLHIWDTFIIQLVLLSHIGFILRYYFRISLHIARRSKSFVNGLKADLLEFFHICRVVVYFILFNLALQLVLCLFWEEVSKQFIDHFFTYCLFSELILILIYEYIRIYWINKKLSKEVWLPVINERTEVVGRVAKSVSIEMVDKLLHPRIRIIIISKGRILLANRPKDEIVKTKRFDTPFFSDLYFGETFDQAIERINKNRFVQKNIKPLFITSYLYEDRFVRRKIFLYIIRLSDEKGISLKNLSNVKFWTELEIDNNLKKAAFSQAFEKEYELLKSTVLMADKFTKSFR